MSEIETYDDPQGVDYGHYEAGAESGELEHLQQASGSESDYDSNFNVYEQDTESAESTDFQQGRHVEFEDPSGARYEETEYTNYSHDEYDSNHIFAAEGSESSHQAEWSQLDALRERFASEFVEGTQYHADGGSELTAK
ncbi:hypothetical protein ACFFX1_34360 [Dactylosporangium sucinum]|uniref:Uncharacterized protein n=1 Tax=Dactylosporangium sucinum TaxID=1424081 RepID=A0A917X791_9ACTN|nr:hypothetical protein [Dactylosporangium sucinum]GGM89333.1 hypothetical protein GCM10007977_109190 [Dactylosporangium sucinum]